MPRTTFPLVTRRSLLVGGACALAGPALARNSALYPEPEPEPPVRRNISGFRSIDWRPHFKTLKKGAILVDTRSRALHFWSEDRKIYRLYPSSVPLNDQMTRRGRTSVVRKVVGPSWAPTPSMKKRNPEWPDFVPPGPDNPMGTHALYLSWKYYRIHGTHDNRKIGRQSSNGCIGLFNKDIADLFSLTRIGTQVLLI
ncbi:L,D-transpeptidase [Pontibaca salina]|uniref:L,D-transpeptidase n=1 Tax=Pontibaca salina TaxID=2795731 RepID=A0A934M037_9RHOB|nr:L,D-transpeptidase [Pontibaca salina]MBI6629338.1 L,D-transpeptidase [Pontibaca salina]